VLVGATAATASLQQVQQRQVQQVQQVQQQQLGDTARMRYYLFPGVDQQDISIKYK
jgi:hypothetical protein